MDHLKIHTWLFYFVAVLVAIESNVPVRPRQRVISRRVIKLPFGSFGKGRPTYHVQTYYVRRRQPHKARRPKTTVLEQTYVVNDNTNIVMPPKQPQITKHAHSSPGRHKSFGNNLIHISNNGIRTSPNGIGVRRVPNVVNTIIIPNAGLSKGLSNGFGTRNSVSLGQIRAGGLQVTNAALPVGLQSGFGVGGGVFAGHIGAGGLHMPNVIAPGGMPSGFGVGQIGTGFHTGLTIGNTGTLVAHPGAAMSFKNTLETEDVDQASSKTKNELNDDA